MDDNGELVFSDRKASAWNVRWLNGVLGFGGRWLSPFEYVKSLPAAGTFDLLIADERTSTRTRVSRPGAGDGGLWPPGARPAPDRTLMGVTATLVLPAVSALAGR